MSSKKRFRILPQGLRKRAEKPNDPPIDKSKNPGIPYRLPGRVSTPPIDSGGLSNVGNKLSIVDYSQIQNYIPQIRSLFRVNPDLGLAVHDMVSLTNTGHEVHFDDAVSPEVRDKMRRHLKEAQKRWGDGVNGMDGLVNKMVAQIWIGGALSNEWVVSNNKDRINNLAMVNPETIVYMWSSQDHRFLPYQKQSGAFSNKETPGLKKLNLTTYKYFGLEGDEEIPYGIPPLLTALESLVTQVDMMTNIRYIVKQIGLMGFVEVLMGKPSQNSDESDAAYTSRLSTLLQETKTSLTDGMIDGMVVGFEEDHKFNFHSTTKEVRGVNEVFNQNEVQVANGLKTPPTFLGVSSGGGTETSITVIFTKMLSQLKNVQSLITANLEHGYALELRLAGFKFDYLSVKFKSSTLTDELKLWQSREIKQRVQRALYADGIISQDEYADSMGYTKPDKKEPRQPIVTPGSGDPVEDEAKRKKREADKDKSDKKVRDKNKPLPKDK